MSQPEYSIAGLVTFPQLAAGYGLISGVIGAASLVRSHEEEDTHGVGA